MGIAEHLNFDVARFLDEFLDEDALVTETRPRLRARQREAFARLGIVPRDAHPLAATARRCLDHHGITDLRGDLHRFLGILNQAHMAGNRGDARLVGEFLGGDLVAHRLDRRSRRAYESNAGGLESLREFGIL